LHGRLPPWCTSVNSAADDYTDTFGNARRKDGRHLSNASAALALGAGGVGYYPRSDFVHVDVGRVRSW
jgi:hypothetical protein